MKYLLIIITAVLLSGCGESENEKLQKYLESERQETTRLKEEKKQLNQAQDDLVQKNNLLSERLESERQETTRLKAEKKQLNQAQNDLVQKNNLLSEQIVELEKKLKRQSELLIAKKEKAQNENWESQIDRIHLLLKIVRDEQDNFDKVKSINNLSFSSDLDREESRLKSICNEQTGASLKILIKLRSEGFPKADELEKQIEEFSSNYLNSILYLKLYKQSWGLGMLRTNRGGDDGGAFGDSLKHLDKRKEYLNKYITILGNIKRF